MEADETNTVNRNNVKCTTHDFTDVSRSSLTFGRDICTDWPFIQMSV